MDRFAAIGSWLLRTVLHIRSLEPGVVTKASRRFDDRSRIPLFIDQIPGSTPFGFRRTDRDNQQCQECHQPAKNNPKGYQRPSGLRRFSRSTPGDEHPVHFRELTSSEPMDHFQKRQNRPWHEAENRPNATSEPRRISQADRSSAVRSMRDLTIPINIPNPSPRLNNNSLGISGRSRDSGQYTITRSIRNPRGTMTSQ
ncbi:MAG: hypothetical protein KatS3mg104_1748 [Phycisphaerae bacterium]|nr:MAG: hypothetical protein KatS3mg104_1748 [Phycisphaerae bacterium]